MKEYMKTFESFVNEAEDDGMYELNVKITNIDEHDLKLFLKLFKAMDYAKVGSSREIKLFVDGDGAFRATIETDHEISKELAEEAIEEYLDEEMYLGFGT